jgi:hypothetical protein
MTSPAASVSGASRIETAEKPQSSDLTIDLGDLR